jgi:rod shape determining protein RodA
MIDRRLIQNFDWYLLLVTCAIAGVGLLTLYSATTSGGKAHPAIVMRQLYWLSLGLVVMVLAFSLDYRWWERFAYPAYLVGLVPLVAVLLLGKSVSGSKRWLDLGFIAFQPSEIMKPLLMVALARYLSQEGRGESLRLRDLGVPALIIMVPAVLVLLEPDLGSAGLLVLIGASVVLFVGVRLSSLLILGGFALGCLPLLWMGMKGYQRQRILTLFSPDRDPLGSGYHIIQSKIAVGSGQIWGKGFLQGTQGQLRFIPEHHTDFIFSVLAEEWGFVGCLLLLGLFLCLLFRALQVARRSRDRFGTLLCVQIAAIIFWQVAVNVAMVLGMAPVVGITLPLVSYGGSSVLVTLGSIGILLNVHMRKFIFQN